MQTDPGMSYLDDWIETLKSCELLSEADVKRLCETVF